MHLILKCMFLVFRYQSDFVTCGSSNFTSRVVRNQRCMRLPTGKICHQPNTVWIIIGLSEVCQTCQMHDGSCLDLPMSSTSSIHQNCIHLRYIRDSLWDWTLCILNLHQNMQISSLSCLGWFLNRIWYY